MQQKHGEPKTANCKPHDSSPKAIMRTYGTENQAVAARFVLVAYYKTQTWQGSVKCDPISVKSTNTWAWL